jgi:hypothetical protein
MNNRTSSTLSAGRLAALGLMFALAACGGGGGDSSAPPTGGTPAPAPSPPAPAPGPAPGPAPSPAPTPAEAPLGLYWSWTEELVPFTTPDGFTYFNPMFRYKFLKFFADGYVYVGEPGGDIDALDCTQRTTDANGDLLCAPYTVTNGTLQIEGEDPVALVQESANWLLGDKTYTPIAPEADLRLAGRYASTSCYMATCTRASFEFRSDGTFDAETTNSYANTVGDLFLGGGSSGTTSGTYRIDGHRITMTLANGRSSTMFFFREGETIMIAEDWYDPAS